MHVESYVDAGKVERQLILSGFIADIEHYIRHAALVLRRNSRHQGYIASCTLRADCKRAALILDGESGLAGCQRPLRALWETACIGRLYLNSLTHAQPVYQFYTLKFRGNGFC